MVGFGFLFLILHSNFELRISNFPPFGFPIMPYRRRLLRYGPSPGQLQSAIEDRAIAGCAFELHRLGGCGQGEVQLKDGFDDRDQLTVGEWLACEYDDGDRWYLGRIEERLARSPGGVTLRLEGMSVQLNEVFPGGFGSDADGAKPHRYAAVDKFTGDPDRQAETVDDVERPEDVVRLLLSQYVAPQTDIRVEAGLIEDAPFAAELASLKFNGEESVRSILKDLALRLRNASWGVDELGRFFLLQARTPTLATFQQGVDLIDLREEQTREAVFNRVLLTGGYVYGSPSIDSAVTAAVRWRGNYRQPASISANGERRIRLWVPWIRTQEDSRQFVREFFRLYAEPARKYTIQTAEVASCPRPWLGRVRVLDRHGDELCLGQPETVRVRFDNAPRLTLSIGPDDPRTHWAEPPHDERFPVSKQPLASGQSGGGGPITLTQGSGSSAPLSLPSSSESSSHGESSSDVTSSELTSSDITSSEVTSSELTSSARSSSVSGTEETSFVSSTISGTSSPATSSGTTSGGGTTSAGESSNSASGASNGTTSTPGGSSSLVSGGTSSDGPSSGGTTSNAATSSGGTSSGAVSSGGGTGGPGGTSGSQTSGGTSSTSTGGTGTGTSTGSFAGGTSGSSFDITSSSSLFFGTSSSVFP